ncbi:MAG TPA: OmpA family protein [Candidatus Eisenbacteria bacterium]|nr:OmpA family protein [Candidatus Eisenbacteria bacterium]
MNRAFRTAVVLVMAAGLTGCVSSGKFNKLKAEQDVLKNEKAELEKQKADLEKQTVDLTQSNTQLKSDIDRLNAESASLAAARDSLAKTHEAAVSQYDAVVNQLSAEVEKGNLQVRQYKNMLTVDVAEQIFFDTGSFTLKKSGQEVLKKVGDAIANYPDKAIRVVGHTDNVPYKSGKWTNWELSAMRATTVVRFLQDKSSIDPQRLVSAGRGQYEPVASNDTPEGRQKNRRIEITLLDKSYLETMAPQQATTGTAPSGESH